jgi:hypothetical protein
MAADLTEKATRYRRLLREALDDAQKVSQEDPKLSKAADEYREMAECYYTDGLHFFEEGDLVNALVCFSYGHAWLDAGVRLGVFRVTREELFAA